MKTATLPLERIHEAVGPNPNRLDEDRYRLLVRGIRELGFLQPLLVRRKGKTDYEVIDGHHRLRAAQEAGLTALPCVVIAAENNEARIRALALNRLRGEMDLAIVSDELLALAKDGWTVDELELTGFSADEVAALLEQPATDAEMLAGVGPHLPREDDGDGKVKVYKLKLEFAAKSDLDLVVLAALDHGATVEAGLLAWAKKSGAKEQ